jgi:hypothetical protein
MLIRCSSLADAFSGAVESSFLLAMAFAILILDESSQKRITAMKLLTILFLVSLLCAPTCSSAQQSTPKSKDIQIGLTQKDKFVVRLMKVINKSGKEIPGLMKLDSFRPDAKLFIFKNSQGNMQKISDKDINEIVFQRVRQGILTGKPRNYRVSAMNGKPKPIELTYSDVKIKDGVLFLSQKKVSEYFNDRDKYTSDDFMYSNKFHTYITRKEQKFPELYSKDFAFNDGYWEISRKTASEYCRACLKIEILNMQPDPKRETLRMRCKEILYDTYYE